MHELSIAYNLVELASAAAAEEGITRVTAVYLKLGVLSGVMKEPLLFGYDIAAKDTVLEGSDLVIEEVPVVVNCPNCGEVELPTIQQFRCPTCETLTADIRRGQELEIRALAYEEENVAQGKAMVC